VDSGSGCTIAAAATSCSVTPVGIALTAGNTVQLEATRATGTTAFTTTATTALTESVPATSLVATPHITMGTATFAATTVGISFGGSSAFSSNTSYLCTVTDVGTPGTNSRYGVTYNSGISATITATGASTATVAYVCIGN
jgi:hypothetical protein